MSDHAMQFPIGTIVVLTAEAGATKPHSFRSGEDLTMASATSGKSSCRVVSVTPERIEVESPDGRYSLSPAAATLEEGGMSGYGGGWVVRSRA